MIFSDGATTIMGYFGEIITTLGVVYLTVGERMYPFNVVADDYLVRAEGVISREIAKTENLENMAITGPLHGQTMIMGRQHDQGNDAPLWAPIEKHVLLSQRKSGNYVSKLHNPPCDGIIGQIHDTSKNREYEHSDESRVRQKYEPCQPRYHSRNGPSPRNWQF